jgi:hypothetical protein
MCLKSPYYDKDGMLTCTASIKSKTKYAKDERDIVSLLRSVTIAFSCICSIPTIPTASSGVDAVLNQELDTDTLNDGAELSAADGFELRDLHGNSWLWNMERTKVDGIPSRILGPSGCSVSSYLGPLGSMLPLLFDRTCSWTTMRLRRLTS